MFVRQTKAATLSATLAALFITQPTSSDKGTLALVIYFLFDLQGHNHQPTRRTMAFYLRQRQQVYKSILLSKLFGVKGTSKVWSNCQKEKSPPPSFWGTGPSKRGNCLSFEGTGTSKMGFISFCQSSNNEGKKQNGNAMVIWSGGNLLGHHLLVIWAISSMVG